MNGTALGPVKIYAQIYLQAPADLKSAGNGDVVQSCLQVLHVHVFFAAPLGTRRVAKPRADQHQGRVAVRERPHHTRPAADLTVQPLDHARKIHRDLAANDLATDLNVHSLRHTAASLFIASGTDVGTVAGLLGHSQPSTTLDIYTHAFDKNKKAASQIMQSSLEI